MRIAIVVVGVVLLLIGLGGALFGFAVANGTAALYSLSCTGSSPPPSPGFCQTLLSSAASYRALGWAMAVVFLLGVGMVIAGAILDEPRGYAPMVMPPPFPSVSAPMDPGRACRNCGRIFPSMDRFCPYCGTPV